MQVLGRPTTLQKASARTIDWIDSEAKRLIRRRGARVARVRHACACGERAATAALARGPRPVPRLGVDRRPLPPRRESLCDQLAKFCDVHKVLHSRGISRLYLANVSKPDERLRRMTA